ncbi:hypothetical protein [Sulfitobacter geojensis]|uniref:hypothetical protein n=1 Tax=Sulfitobacter geojensis TaxID=1342299 RepID=UPI003B8EA331
MSDPVTNAEVEDVLSSIRRLVSEDKRPVKVAKSEPKTAVFRHAEAVPSEPKPDRLVLTPALRVTEAPSAKASADADTGSDVDINKLVADDTPLDVFAPRAVAMPEPPQDDADILVFDDVPEEELFDDPAHDYSTDPYNFDDETDDDGEGHAQNGGRSQASVTEEIPHDTGEDDATEISETAILMQPQEPQQDEQDAPRADAKPAPPKGQGMGTSMASDKSLALTAKIAALETAIGQISETWEPDDAGESDYAGSEGEAMAWEDDAPEQPILSKSLAFGKEQQNKAEPSEETETLEVMESQLEEFFANSETSKDTAETAVEPPAAEEASHTEKTSTFQDKDAFEFPAEEQLIDEEVLRDLVSDIVRAELQGALGERITRNVRKLVRREIHRALAAQDLE